MSKCMSRILPKDLLNCFVVLVGCEQGDSLHWKDSLSSRDILQVHGYGFLINASAVNLFPTALWIIIRVQW